MENTITQDNTDIDSVNSGFKFSEITTEPAQEQGQETFSFKNEIVPEIIVDTVVEDKVVTPNAEENILEPTIEESVEDDYIELDENVAWNYLKEKKGLSIDNLDELLTPKEQKKYAPEIEKFQEFVEKTGNHSYKDFEATQKDWKQEDSELVLKEFIKSENKNLTDREVNFLYEQKYKFDEDIDEEDFITERQINIKVDLEKAYNYLEKQKEEFMVHRGSDEYIPQEYKDAKSQFESLQKRQEEYDLTISENLNDYIAKTNEVFSKDFEGFKIKLGNDEIGFEEVSIKPDNISQVKATQSDIVNFNKKFFNEQTGKLEKPKEWHEAIYMANNYKEELNKAYNRGIAKQLEIDDKLSKNIQADNLKNINTPKSTGYKFFAEE